MSDRDYDRQTYRSLRRGDHNHKENENEAIEPSVCAREGHKREIYRVEHQLDGHEDRDDVALKHDGNGAEPE